MVKKKSKSEEMRQHDKNSNEMRILRTRHVVVSTVVAGVCEPLWAAVSRCVTGLDVKIWGSELQLLWRKGKKL